MDLFFINVLDNQLCTLCAMVILMGRKEKSANLLFN